ncbi:MAG: Cold shock-like protein CspD [Syntrophus sp. PtaB.Bin075]|nr:MAG: Cold shock-like protein CspD [Syntrophus sp. PtaB.Bin075]
MPEGTVKWFSGSFGNIEQDGGKDAYVHYSVIQHDDSVLETERFVNSSGFHDEKNSHFQYHNIDGSNSRMHSYSYPCTREESYIRKRN